MNKPLITAVFLGILSACGEKYECETDADCEEGQECVISHDHEGDDHDHGGTCSSTDTGS